MSWGLGVKLRPLNDANCWIWTLKKLDSPYLFLNPKLQDTFKDKSVVQYFVFLS